jgi:hypothetical protein
MNATLTVDDPLVGQEVTIVVTLPAGDGPRDKRPILVSLGVTGQPPIIKTGAFADAPDLMNEAWTAFGVRAQVAGAAPSELETETADEELVATAAVPQEPPALPEKPPAGNLSLF